MRFPVIALLAVAALASSACAIVYKLPTRQGNVIEQEKLDQLALGMSRDQVHYLLGTPLAASPFTEQRWDYLGYYRPPRGKASSRVVTLYFENDRLARMEGVEQGSGSNSADIEKSDVEAVLKAEEKDKQDTQAPPQSGVVITPDDNLP